MISNTMIKIINILPKRFVILISKKVVGNYITKYAKINIVGSDYLQDIDKPTIFVCNHLSNSDGLVLSKVLKDIDPTFVAGVKLSSNSLTSIGLNVVKTTSIKPNSADTEGLKNIISLVKKGESILIFPEGTRSRTESLMEAKKGIILIAKMTGVPIVPIGIYGTEKLLPINKDSDMSAEKFEYADVNINIGKQFVLIKKEKGQDRKDYAEFTTNYIMKKIAELLPESYRGVYKDV